MLRAAIALATMTLVLGGCAGRQAKPVVRVEPPAVEETTGWRALVTEADRARLAQLPGQWTMARAAVPARLRTRLRTEAELVEPAAALELPAPPPGPYRCRLVRFNARGGMRTFAPDFCYVDGDGEGLSFTKQTGRNLPTGWLHTDTPTRLVFLGTMPPPGSPAILYGRDAAQDVAGVVERVSPFRWRLTMTRAGKGALLDVYELVPVTPEVPGATPAVPAKER